MSWYEPKLRATKKLKGRNRQKTGLFSCYDSAEQSYSRKTHLAHAVIFDKSVTASCTEDIIIFIEVPFILFL